MGTQLVVIRQRFLAQVPKIREILPAGCGVTAERLVRVFLLEIFERPELRECTEESLLAALIESGRTGLEIGGPMPQAYIVPYKRRAVFVVGYRGLVDMVLRSGRVTGLNVELVYQGDTFHREPGIYGKLIHRASDAPDRESRPITHVYSEFEMTDGKVRRFCMSAEQINKHAEHFSKTFSQPEGAWKTSWEAMASKTLIRRPVQRGLIPIRLNAAEMKHVLFDENPARSTVSLESMSEPEERLVLDTSESQEISCDDGGEIFDDSQLTDEEKAAILAAEREAG